jgi:hypothetical protein
MNALLVEKNGNIKNINIKEDSLEYLCKKCSFKNTKDFECRTTWNVKMNSDLFNIKLYSKTNGRANSENKYDFPPPVDNELYFGTCILINYDDNDIVDLTEEDWIKVYEKLFGGFENLADTIEEDENEEDELENVPDSMKTKQGYLKDGFVVDDPDEDEEEDENEED